MIVSELVELLLTQDQQLEVAYRCFSESCLLEVDDIKVVWECAPRSDGWIHNRRPDKEMHPYLMFPGN
jgi:hypothetical protein